jgi:aspartyl-tRNA(Asn)/glutamyl-tRNA(Gln) amidotransferase subunit A
MQNLLQLPLTDVVRSLTRKEASPIELMRSALERIEATNSRLNAFVAMRDEAALLAEARDAEARILRGEARPLEGVPLGVKDLEDVAGMVTSHGSKVFRDNVAERDGIQVARLKAAGAIVVGKTNAPEFGATAITTNPLYGATRNPWNLERTPGGSSGGSSAAIAAGVVPLVTAGDGGGSIRIPASFTGCFGLKTSYGRIPRGPGKHWVTGDTAVFGPLTRTVEDAALFLDVTAGPHPLDPNTLPAPGISYRKTLRDLPAKLRIAYSADLGYAVVQSDVAAAVARAARAFEELGHTIEPVEGGPPEMGTDWGMAGAFELLGELEPYFAEHEQDFGRGFLRGVKVGARVTPAFFAAVRERREVLNRWCAALFDEYDLLVTPTVPYDPPPAKGPFPETLQGKKLALASVASFTIPFNLSWHPAATVRAGFSNAKLPVGLQIVAPRHRDDLVLQASYAYEQARPWMHEWPLV